MLQKIHLYYVHYDDDDDSRKVQSLETTISLNWVSRFVIMDDDELTHLEHIVKNEIREPHCFVCHICKEDLHSLD